MDLVAETIVEIAAGKLRGVRRGGISAFKGVPYAASPEGRNRFRPPAPAVPWIGIRDAIAYAGHAPQFPSRPSRRPELDRVLGPPDETPIGEDCLTLNVWTPGPDTKSRPVMVWLHGGAFSFGSGNRAVSDGSNLARRGDVVVVAVNHRLNILGFLDLADIAGADYAGSGNAGILDLVAALRWVHENIERFGGDPGNVTIFGESGGGAKVATLMAMPAARGLFHRAIVQSGAAVRLRTRERAVALTAAVLAALGLPPRQWERLLTLPIGALNEAIAPAQKAIGGAAWPLLDRYDFGPVVDGIDLPRHPADPDALGISDDVPLMIGDAAEEAAFFLSEEDVVWNRAVTEPELRARIAAVAGTETDAILDFYGVRDPGATPTDRLIAALTGSNFWVRSVLLAERKAARRRATVHMYSLAWRSPIHDGRMKAHHVIDLPFVFDTVDIAETTAGQPGAQELAARVSATWIAFARHGRPTSPVLPDWPAYTPDERAVMVLDRECRVVRDPDREARLIWSRVATGA